MWVLRFRVQGPVVQGSGFRATMLGVRENNYFTEMCSGFEAGSYLKLIDFVHHSTLGLRVIKKKREKFRRGMCLIPSVVEDPWRDGCSSEVSSSLLEGGV